MLPLGKTIESGERRIATRRRKDEAFADADGVFGGADEEPPAGFDDVDGRGSSPWELCIRVFTTSKGHVTAVPAVPPAAPPRKWINASRSIGN